MTFFDVALEVFGWIGTALVVVSLAQSRIVRLHVLNLVASAMLVVYNGVLGVAPGVGLNIALFAVNLWRLRALLRARTAPAEATVEGARHAE